MCPPGEMWDYFRNIPNEPSKCNQWKHFHRMSSEHLKCSLPLPTGRIVGKMHMSSKCTQHVITGFQAPLPPVIVRCHGWDIVIALTFFALFSRPSPSFKPYDPTTLSLFLYPDNHWFIPFPFISPFHTSQEQDEMAHGLLLTIHYWYMRIGIAIVERPFADPVDPPDTPHANSHRVHRRVFESRKLFLKH